MRAILLEADWEPRGDYSVTPEETLSRKARMASQVWRNPRFASAVVDDPEPGPGEVIVQVKRCGVCGSDTHCYETDEDGYVIFSGPVQLPVIPGHEYSGEVVAVGAGVQELQVGDLVAAVVSSIKSSKSELSSRFLSHLKFLEACTGGGNRQDLRFRPAVEGGL